MGGAAYQIRILRTKEIVAYAREASLRDQPVIAITPERALSQQHNPHARPDDPLLWVAENKKGRIIGFAGSLPSRLTDADRPMGWNTCWWTDRDEGKDAALPLLMHFLQHWDQEVAFADMTEHTHAIIRQLGFCHLREDVLLRTFIRLPGEKILDRTGRAAPLLSPLLRPLVRVLNGSLSRRLKASLRGYGSDSFAYRVMGTPDPESEAFLVQHNGNDFSRRGPEDFQWAMEYPWLAEDPHHSHKDPGAYPFSHRVRSFRMEWIRVEEEGRLNALMLISVRDGALKVLYYYGSGAAAARWAVFQYALGNRDVYSISYAHPSLLLAEAGKGQRGFRTSRIPRYTGISRKLRNNYPPELIMQLGDGDALFT